MQYSCIADGWQAATGVSAGKLNPHVVESTPEKLESVVLDKSSAREPLFSYASGIVRKYIGIPFEKQAVATREVASLPDEQIFTVAEGKTVQAKPAPDH